MYGREYKIFLFPLNVKRILEPELMKGDEQVKAYAEADFSSGDASLILKLEEYICAIRTIINNKSLIVDIGCGPGNITERLAMRWPFATVMGIDGSEEMLAIARSRKKKNEYLKEMKDFFYVQQNLSSFSKKSLKLARFADVVVSNSVLHHIHDPSVFWSAIKIIGKKGTIVFHKDLRRPSSYQEAIMLLKK